MIDGFAPGALTVGACLSLIWGRAPWNGRRGSACSECLSTIDDPRQTSNGTLHDFREMLVIMIAAVLFGAFATDVGIALGQHRSRMANSLPSYAAVRDEAAYHGPLTEQPVSLKALPAKEAREAEIVSASFMDLHDDRLKRPWKLALIALGAALLAASLLKQPSWSDLSLLSASIGAIVLLTVMFFAQTLAVPRRRIESERR